MQAFVYLRAEPSRIDDVVIELAGKHGVRHAVPVTGEWDVLIAVEGADFVSVARDVKREILSIGGVTRSYTAPVVPLDMIGIHGGGWATPGMPLNRDEACCYVHIQAETGTVANLVESLSELEDVSGIAVVGGDYDVLVELPESWEIASRIILEVIHAIPGVLRTSTSIGVPALADDAD